MSLGCDLLAALCSAGPGTAIGVIFLENIRHLEEEDLGNGGGWSLRNYFVSVKFPGTLVPLERSNMTSSSPRAKEALSALPRKRAAATEASGQEP